MGHIDVSVIGINVSCDQHGRVQMDWDQEQHGLPPRQAEILAGASNLAPKNIVLIDASPKDISVEETLRSFMPDGSPAVEWDFKQVTGVNEVERIYTFTPTRVGNEYVWSPSSTDHLLIYTVRDDHDIRPPEHKNDRVPQGNVFRAGYDGNPRGEGSFRCRRKLNDGSWIESVWLGAADGRGLRFGSQA